MWAACLALLFAGAASPQGLGVQQLPGAGLSQAALRPGNVLLILADDVGNDKVAAYGEHPAPPPTPTLDSLAAGGVLFRNHYSYPICSPTRALIMTGRYAFRTGLGANLKPQSQGFSLTPYEVALPELVELGTHGRFENALVGKWHLGTAAWGGALNPLLSGWRRHRGLVGNFASGEDYFHWTKTINGNLSLHTEYVTTDQVDDAIALTGGLQEPWLVCLWLTSAHVPLHAPPAQLHSYSLSGSPSATPVEHFDAAVEAMDTELGRLLSSMDPQVLANTTVLFAGDNGPPGAAVTAPFDPLHAKGYLHEGGVNVPLIAWGRGVAKGQECRALVSAVDLYATMAELAGFAVADALPDDRPVDALSLVPYLTDPARPSDREYVFAEKFQPNGPAGYGTATTWGRMIRDDRWKVIERKDMPDMLFDLQGLNVEGENLMPGPLTPEQQAAYTRLKAALVAILTS